MTKVIHGSETIRNSPKVLKSSEATPIAIVPIYSSFARADKLVLHLKTITYQYRALRSFITTQYKLNIYKYEEKFVILQAIGII